MNIKQVTTAHKVAEFTYNTGRGKAPLALNWFVDKSIQKDTSGRVYLLVVDGIIKKIGGSADKGGIKGTMNAYAGGAAKTKGRPSQTRHSICLLIKQALDYGSQVDVYLIPSQRVRADVTGLFDTSPGLVAPFKEMEDKCVADYVRVEGAHPEWNFKEAGNAFSAELQALHVAHLEEALAM